MPECAVQVRILRTVRLIRALRGMRIDCVRDVTYFGFVQEALPQMRIKAHIDTATSPARLSRYAVSSGSAGNS